MTEIMPVPRNLILLSYQQGALQRLFFYVSLSKNYANAPVSAIIEETGVFSWKAGEKMHGKSQSS